MTAEVSNPPTAGEAILALRRLNSALAVSNRAVGAALGIKGSDLVVLDALSQAGPQTPTELAHRTHTHVATMTGILTRLERDGWIERRHDDTDPALHADTRHGSPAPRQHVTRGPIRISRAF